jgi:type II secretory pathway component GspD/PulD (secretin)
MKSVLAALVVLCISPDFLSACPTASEISVPTELVSRVYSLKYAKAAEIAWLFEEENFSNYDKYGILRNRVRGNLIENELKRLGKRIITVDERSNSLLIKASAIDHGIIQRVLAHLDEVLAQVFIEAVVFLIPHEDGPAIHYPINLVQWRSKFSKLTQLAAHPVAEDELRCVSNLVGSAQNTFRYVAKIRGDFDSSFCILANNTNFTLTQRPRIQTSVGIPATLYTGCVSGSPFGTGARYYSGSSAMQAELSNVTIDVSCDLDADQSLWCNLQQEVGPIASGPTKGSQLPIANIHVGTDEMIVLGGMISSDRIPIFPTTSAFENLPRLNNLMNSVVTYPKHTVTYELAVLIYPRLLWREKRMDSDDLKAAVDSN